MKITLDNIGKVRFADIEIDGISVIAGENNTGKSTVGKALFSIFNSFYNIEEQIFFERSESIERILGSMYSNATNRYSRRVDVGDIARQLVENIKLYRDDPFMLKDFVLKSLISYDENFHNNMYNEDVEHSIYRVQELLNIPDYHIFSRVLEKKLYAEFNGQVSNLFSMSDSRIKLTIKENSTSVYLRNNNIVEIESPFDLRTEVVYLDDPFVLDEFRNSFYRYNMNSGDHRTHLKELLFFEKKDPNILEEIFATSKFEKIFNLINSICDGEIVKSKRSGLGYKISNTDKVLDARSLSTGLKTFAILKTLLTNGALEYNGTIVLDEPEIHLHPEWQLLLAEIIVLLNKEFGIHILLNTHSPYFLRAIQVYAAKHQLSSKCRYYLSESINEHESHIVDVTDNIEMIYFKLSQPLQKLEDTEW